MISISGSWLMLSAESREFSTSSRMVVYRHFPGCIKKSKRDNDEIEKGQGSGGRRQLTLSKPAMFLFSAKNSAGDFCSSTSPLTAALAFGAMRLTAFPTSC